MNRPHLTKRRKYFSGANATPMLLMSGQLGKHFLRSCLNLMTTYIDLIVLHRCIFGELLCGGRKLFAANSVNANSRGEVKRFQMDSEATNEHRVEDVRMWEEETNHAKSVAQSSASLNSGSIGRTKTETLVESLRAIFEVKPHCLVLAESCVETSYSLCIVSLP